MTKQQIENRLLELKPYSDEIKQLQLWLDKIHLQEEADLVISKFKSKKFKFLKVYRYHDFYDDSYIYHIVIDGNNEDVNDVICELFDFNIFNLYCKKYEGNLDEYIVENNYEELY